MKHGNARFSASSNEIRCLPQGGSMCALGRAVGALPLEVSCHRIGHVASTLSLSMLDTQWACKTTQGGDATLSVVCAAEAPLKGAKDGAPCVISHGTEDLEAILALLAFSVLLTSCAACAMCVAWAYVHRRRRWHCAWRGGAY